MDGYYFNSTIFLHNDSRAYIMCYQNKIMVQQSQSLLKIPSRHLVGLVLAHMHILLKVQD